MMIAAEVTFKSPFVLLFQRENFLHRTLHLLEKHVLSQVKGVKGGFLDGVTRELFGQLLRQDHLQAAQKDLRGKAREKSTSGGVLSQYVGARRSSTTKAYESFSTAFPGV